MAALEGFRAAGFGRSDLRFLSFMMACTNSKLSWADSLSSFVTNSGSGFARSTHVIPPDYRRVRCPGARNHSKTPYRSNEGGGRVNLHKLPFLK